MIREIICVLCHIHPSPVYNIDIDIEMYICLGRLFGFAVESEQWEEARPILVVETTNFRRNRIV